LSGYKRRSAEEAEGLSEAAAKKKIFFKKKFLTRKNKAV